MSLERYGQHKLAKLRGGEDSYSILNYSPPRWNSEANMLEMHVPLNNYTGPYTDVRKRWIEKKLHGTNPVDEAARHHDIQYRNLGIARSRGKITEAQLEKGIVNSDKQLLNVAKNNLYGTNPLTVASAHAANVGITLKRGLQDWNLIRKNAFVSTSANKQYMNEDRPEEVNDIPNDYLQGGKRKKKDRLARLKKVLKE